MIEIRLDEAIVEAGSPLSGEVRWRQEGRRVSRFLVAAEWRTDGFGNIATGVGRSKSFEVVGFQTEGVIRFRLLVPYEGPISFEGELVTVVWKLYARAELTGFDEVAEADFRVVARTVTPG